MTLLGCTDEPDRWRSERATGGAIVDVGADEVVAGGLSMPFCPRWHDGRLWFTQAGTGEVCVVEDDDTVTVVARLDTFVRGLNLVGPYAVVAGSGSRSISLIEGLPIGDRLIAADRRPEQGVFVIDTRTGEVAHRLTIEGTGREVPAMTVLPGRASTGADRPGRPGVADHGRLRPQLGPCVGPPVELTAWAVRHGASSKWSG